MSDIEFIASPNHGPRPDGIPVDMLVLHYTGMARPGAALAWLCRPESEVSAHYLVEENGAVYQLVAEERRAWHAGVAAWRGQRDINGQSIGIEIVNPGHEFGYRAFPQAQVETVVALCQDIMGRHPIVPRNVVGHSDVAPGRKQDPGELFPWQDLAAAGIGLWPEPATEVRNSFEDLLIGFGYALTGNDFDTVCGAFQRHFRPARIDGVADDECHRILQGLMDLVGVR